MSKCFSIFAFAIAATIAASFPARNADAGVFRSEYFRATIYKKMTGSGYGVLLKAKGRIVQAYREEVDGSGYHETCLVTLYGKGGKSRSFKCQPARTPSGGVKFDPVTSDKMATTLLGGKQAHGTRIELMARTAPFKKLDNPFFGNVVMFWPTAGFAMLEHLFNYTDSCIDHFLTTTAPLDHEHFAVFEVAKGNASCIERF